MCPKNDDRRSSSSDCSNRSDCSIDEERQGTIDSVPCPESGGGVVGYRKDATADGACDALRLFSERVSNGGVHVGDCDFKTKLTERFAGGSFGELYVGELLRSGKKVAVKVEPQGGAHCNFLLQEGAVYRNLEGGPGIPKVYWFGFHGSEYRALIMDLLGPTLEDLFRLRKRTLSMKTLLMLADKMLAILRYVHSRSYVHRDISPSNFVFGCGESANELYLIDFGHAKKFTSGSFVIPRRRNSASYPRAVVGTPRFISIHAHLSHDESPRDDLEAMGYILVYLARGSLPWQGVRAHTMPEKLNKIADIKMNTSPKDLCHGLPEEFALYLDYVRSLKLHEEPDYDGIRELFRSLAARLDITYDDKFDWTDDVVDQVPLGTAVVSEPKEIPTVEHSDDADSPKVTPVSR